MMTSIMMPRDFYQPPSESTRRVEQGSRKTVAYEIVIRLQTWAPCCKTGQGASSQGLVDVSRAIMRFDWQRAVMNHDRRM